MDSFLLSEHLEVISRFLQCLPGEEDEIIQSYSTVIDENFLNTLATVSQDLHSKGELSKSDYLDNIANKIAKQLGVSIYFHSNFDAHINFFVSFDLKMSEKGIYEEQLYKQLDEDAAYLTIELAENLPVFLKNFHQQMNKEWQITSAWKLMKFARIIHSYPRGDKSINLEIAIGAYKAALELGNISETVPEVFASLQNSLGIAYSERIKGDKDNNLELSISAYQKALDTYNRTSQFRASHLIDWAFTQKNLAISFSERTAGSRLQNFKVAEKLYKEILTAIPRANYPAFWEETQLSLENLYKKDLSLDRSTSIEKALTLLEDASPISNRDNNEDMRDALNQLEMGHLYFFQTKGNVVENIENAIMQFKTALQVFERLNQEYYCAISNSSLGMAYSRRYEGVKEENIEVCIAYFEKSLRYLKIDNHPDDWASTKINLGIAFRQRTKGEKAVNIKSSIMCLKKALLVKTLKKFPEDWAAIQNNLGQSVIKDPSEEESNRVEKAIDFYQKALSVRTYEKMPFKWAIVKINIAQAYRIRIKGTREENLAISIQAYRDAMRVCTFRNDPMQFLSLDYELYDVWHEYIKCSSFLNVEAHPIQNTEELNKLLLRRRELINDLRNVFLEQFKSSKNKVSLEENLKQVLINNSDIVDINLAEAFRSEIDMIASDLSFPPEFTLCVYQSIGSIIVDIEDINHLIRFEISTAIFEAILDGFNDSTSKEAKADVQKELSYALLQRKLGNKSSHIERAIHLCILALQVFTPENHLEKWASCLGSLASMFGQRYVGERSDNIEKTIFYLEKLLEKISCDNLPETWANAQVNLGQAYIFREQGNALENVNRGLAALNEALSFFSLENNPSQWLRIYNILGLIHKSSKFTQDKKSIEKSIGIYTKTLEFCNRCKFPNEWIMLTTNLADAYSSSTKVGCDQHNWEVAKSLYKEALNLATKIKSLSECARINFSLGTLHLTKEFAVTSQENFIQFKSTLEDLALSLKYFKAALVFYTPKEFPNECFSCSVFYGNIAFSLELWDEVIYGFSLSVEAIETRRINVNNIIRKNSLLASSIHVYDRLVEACIRKSYYAKAIEYMERGKAQSLVEILSNKRLYPNKAYWTDYSSYTQICRRLDNIRNTILSELQETEDESFVSGSRNSHSNFGIVIDSSREEKLISDIERSRNELLQEIRELDPSFCLTQDGSRISYSEIRDSVDDRTAIVYWYISSSVMFVLVITSDSEQPILHKYSSVNHKRLLKRVKSYFKLYNRTKSNWWRFQLERRLSEFSDLLEIENIVGMIPNRCTKLLIVPHRILHLIPIHVLLSKKQHNTSNNIVQELDLFSRFQDGVYYAPSIQMLKLAEKTEGASFNKLSLVKGADYDLGFTDIETSLIQETFPKVEIIEKFRDDRTEREFEFAHCVHFSCHGYFNAISPMESYLRFSDDEVMTLSEIFHLSLPNCSLVTLAACETGRVDTDSLIDEYIGLPSAFLHAGSSSVVASLWKVDDAATAFLMSKFYENMRYFPSVSAALNDAQNWLRNVTGLELRNWLNGKRLTLNSPSLDIYIGRLSDGYKPFKDPYYWASFFSIGFQDISLLNESINKFNSAYTMQGHTYFGEKDE